MTTQQKALGKRLFIYDGFSGTSYVGRTINAIVYSTDNPNKVELYTYKDGRKGDYELITRMRADLFETMANCGKVTVSNTTDGCNYIDIYQIKD